MLKVYKVLVAIFFLGLFYFQALDDYAEDFLELRQNVVLVNLQPHMLEMKNRKQKISQLRESVLALNVGICLLILMHV